jgi:2',3'-cyclic-nucleotide 2'-phosphodiesterase (5'-nucleotidase family)
MKNKIWLLAIAALSLSACKSTLKVAQVQPHKNTSITSEIKDNADYVNFIKPYKEGLDKQMNTKVSHTSVELNKKGNNSNLGNLLADFTYEGAKDWASKNNILNVDASVINIGGIRAIIGAGDILVKNVFEVMPFENEIVLVKMKGSDLDGLFTYYAETEKNNPVSHLYIETQGKSLKNALINGEKVDVNKTYYIATSDYLALGGDNMKFFSKGEIINTGLKMRDVFMEFFKKNPEIKASTETRLNFIGKTNE